MSLDNNSHLGRPVSDELVPSRYALRVGEIDVLVVSDMHWRRCEREASEMEPLEPRHIFAELCISNIF